MNFLIYILIAAALASCCQSIDVKFKDCGSQVGVVSSVSVEPCSAQPCKLPKGKNYTIGVTFTSAETTSLLHSKVYGTVLGLKVPFSLPQADGCTDSGITCPVQKGKQYTYTSTLPLSQSYPNVKVLVEWDLMDHESAGNKLFCTEFLIFLVD